MTWPDRLEQVLTKGERFSGWLWDLLLTILLWIVLVRPGWRNLRNRYKAYDVGSKRHFDAEHAKLLWQMTNESSEHTDAKVRQLLTLSAALTPIAILLARQSHPQFLGWLITGSLIAAVLLCVGAVMEVRKSVVPTLGEIRDDGSHLKDWAWDLFSSSQANLAIHHLRVDFYAAARRYFLIAFLLTPIAAITTLVPQRSSSRARFVISHVQGSAQDMSGSRGRLVTRRAAARQMDNRSD